MNHCIKRSMLFLSPVLLSAFILAACSAKQTTIAYSVKVVGATIPEEKAPGVTWDKPDKDSGFLAGLCQIAVGLGTAAVTAGTGGLAATAAPGIVALAMNKCEVLRKEGDPAVAMPDPYVEIIVEEIKYIIPPKGNTLKPMWNEVIEVEYKKELSLLVAVYDNDGKDGELIGTGTFRPEEQGDEPFEVQCEGAQVTFEVKPLYQDKSKEKEKK